jgi:hypothetical protein
MGHLWTLLTFQGRQVLMGGLVLQFTTSDNKAKNDYFQCQIYEYIHSKGHSHPLLPLVLLSFRFKHRVRLVKDMIAMEVRRHCRMQTETFGQQLSGALLKYE